MIEALRRLFGRTEEAVTRLTREEALTLAKKAAAAANVTEELTMSMVRKKGDRLLWVIGTPTVGSGWTVEIDDANGMVGPVQRWGVR